MNINNKLRTVQLILVAIVISISIFKMEDVTTIMLRGTVVLIFAYCINKGLKEEKLLNPYFLFALTPLSLLLYSEKFAPMYLHKLTNETWILGIINMIGFLIGIKRTPRKNRRSAYKLVHYQNNVIFIHIVILNLLGVIPAVCKIIHVAVPFGSFLGFFIYIALAMSMKTKNLKYIIITLFFFCLNFLEDFNKSRFLYLAISFICCYEAYYIKTFSDKKRLISWIAILSFFMIFIAFPLKSFTRDGGSFIEFAVDAGRISDTAFEYYDDRFNFNGPDFLKMPYMYIINSWNNVQYVLQTQDWHTYGLWTIKPLLTYLQIVQNFESAYYLEPESSFNTFTFIPVLYKDWGYWGSVLGSIFLGFYVKTIYNRYQKNGSPFDIASYGLVAVATFQMYFSNHFYYLSYPFTIVIISYLYKTIFKLRNL